jgi:hypothetical protein
MNSGSISAGSISGMSVGTNAGSITSAGQGTITGINIDLNTGSVTASADDQAGSGALTSAAIGTLTGLVTAASASNLTVNFINGGAIHITNDLTTLAVVTLGSADLSAGRFKVVTAMQVTVPVVNLKEPTVTRTLQLTSHGGGALPASYGFAYDGTGTGDPQVTIQLNAGSGTNVSYDLGVLTDTVGKPGSGFDLAGLYAVGPADIRNLVVGGDLVPSLANPGFFGLPATTAGGVQLPLDSVAVAVAGNVPSGSIVVQSAPAIAFGFANGISAANAKTTDATGLFAPGMATVQANDTFQVFVGDGVPVALFLVTNTNGSNFDGKNVLFTDEGADFRPVTAQLLVTSGSPSTIQRIDLRGEGASFQTQQLVNQAINVVSGSLGDVTLSAPGGSPANITAPRIVGNIDITNGGISGTIQTTAGDLGQAIIDPATGKITGVTFIRTGGGGLTSTGKIISAANLVSLIALQSNLDGVIAAQGDIGVIQLDATGNAPQAPAALTRFGGITVSTGGVNGQIVALGNVFGDISVTGGLGGRIAVKGKEEYGLSRGQNFSRTGILGNVTIGGGISTTGAIFSAALLGDDGSDNIKNDTKGTQLNISGTDKGIIAAEEDINFGSTGSLNQAGIFENVGSTSAAKYRLGVNKAQIDAVFSDQNVALTIPDGLSLILADLLALTVDANGNLTGATA